MKGWGHSFQAGMRGTAQLEGGVRVGAAESGSTLAEGIMTPGLSQTVGQYIPFLSLS